MGKCIIVRGGGDLATGVVQKFHRSGYNVVILETHTPTAIRRSVSLCEAVYDGTKTVEDIHCRKAGCVSELQSIWDEGSVPLLIDPDGKYIKEINPSGLIDAIMAKCNTGTAINMAAVTIALGPGFEAGRDVHAVIETKRGHNLGKTIFYGKAEPNTGIPGEIAGESIRRVIHAPAKGIIKHIKHIGDTVKLDDDIAEINNSIRITAPISGLLRGLIRDGISVNKGMKIADIDPRTDIDCSSISDKARAVGGAALEAYLHLTDKQHGGERNGK